MTDAVHEFIDHPSYIISNEQERDQTNKMTYFKIPKNSDTRKFAVITLKVEQGGFILE